ncbi:MAG: glycolate oxidase subunit GlcE [Sulfuriflexus sp.]|nr:glycolate oxidase subunit GlcE [Sulfuriflexus sp.]
MSSDISTELQKKLEHAFDNDTAVNIKGHSSKDFYGRRTDASLATLETTQHSGIIDYQPTELVITARCGTSIEEIEKTLATENQMFAFEPPRFNHRGSIGGMVACGLSGPARPYAGSLRDAVLGITCLNGKAEKLSYGGQVMKNVAGYDISRLMTGAMGTLGVILDASIKVMPKPETEITLKLEKDATQAMQTWQELGKQALPISASCHLDDTLYIRLSGNAAAVKHATSIIGGEADEAGHDFWQALRDQQHDFFTGNQPLWRLSLAPATLTLNLTGKALTDWAGAQRWIRTDEPANVIRALCESHGGHATLFNPSDNNVEAFHPLAPGIAALHTQLKQAFDPAGILNPMRMLADY